MKNVRSIVPLLPAQQLMLTATLKGASETYIQQLLFEVKGHSFTEVNNALEKLVQVYECFRSLLLFEGLKQPVWVCREEIKPSFIRHEIEEKSLYGLIGEIRSAGFDFQKEPCLRFDWIVTSEKNLLCITNHHVLFDGWGKQLILSDFIRLLKFPNTYFPERLNKNWFEAWSKLDHFEALKVYRKYLLPFDDYALLTSIASSVSKNHEIKTEITKNHLAHLSKLLGLTVAELINFSWSCFMVVWTKNSKVQFGVVKNNGLVDQVKNGFGMGIQTLPFQFELNTEEKIKDLLPGYLSREREVSKVPFVNLLDPIFSQISYSFMIAFENYPLEESLQNVTDEFHLEFAYDRSEFPLSLAITPFNLHYEFDWHYNTRFHTKEQISSVASAFKSFLNSFDLYLNYNLKELSTRVNFFASDKKVFDNPSTTDFFTTIEGSLKKENRLAVYENLSRKFRTLNFQRIWIYGDKHPMMDLVLVAAWKADVEVLMVNEKETDGFINYLMEKFAPDLIFSNNADRNLNRMVMFDQFDQIDFPLAINKVNNRAALMICTSGSTGEPKVVKLSILNLITFFHAWDFKVPWRVKECFAVVAHPAFDIGVAELIYPLWKGWEKILLTKEMLAEEEIMISCFQQITAFHMVPALLESWILVFPNDGVERIIMTGGDRVPQRIEQNLHKKFPNCKLFQFYGPSECSVLTVGFENTGQFPPDVLPLGTAFSNANIHVLSDDFQQCSFFQEGEIVITGPAVGMGYANTSSEDNFFNFNGNPAYRTGDRGLMDNQGQVYFRGRRDHQVKINGQRIELTRIEQQLISWSGIDSWIVIYKEPVLAAFYSSSYQDALPDKEQLLKVLPAYAVPQVIMRLSSFPLNKNGKIDIKELQNQIAAITLSDQNNVLPDQFTAILNELFPDRKLHVNVGWFANGFNSIDAMKLSGKIKKTLHKTIRINSILTCLNLMQLPSLLTDYVEETENQIEAGKIVHEASSRLFFLSESDARLAKGYWIHFGFQLTEELEFIDFLKAWVTMQKHLALKIISDKSNYLWKEGFIDLVEYDSSNEKDFIASVKSQAISPFECLFRISYFRNKNNISIAFTIHHGLLDGLGIQQLIDGMHQDFLSKKITVFKLFAPEIENVDTSFWRNYLAKVIVQKLPFERMQPEPKKNVLRKHLSTIEQEKIYELKDQLQCSIFEAALILWMKHWYRFYPESTFSSGIAVNTRSDWSSERLVAMSVNTLPFVASSNDEREILQQWTELATRFKQPFSEIAKLETQKQQEGTPFFNTSFVYNQWEDTKGFRTIDFDINESSFDLSLDFINQGSEWYFQWEYNSQKFSETAIERFHNGYFEQLTPIDAAPIESELELTSLAETWEKIITKHKDRISIRTDKTELTYAQLNELIETYRGKIEHHSKGIFPLVLERKTEHIALLMAHILSGIPFIPIDFETPLERIQLIEKACGQEAIYPGRTNKPINENKAFSSDLIYAIATSGSTGTPKLVGVKRSGFEAAIGAWRRQYKLSENDKVLQAASFSFDVFMGDIGRAFFNGAELVLLDPHQRKDPTFIKEEIQRRKITVFETTPMVVRWWIQEPPLPFDSLRLLIVGSDSWKIGEMNLLRSMLKATTHLISSYGLSETTIDNSFFEWTANYNEATVVPIGKPMLHTEMSIRNINGENIIQGREGLLCIDGPCVGKGYFDGKTWSHSGGAWLTADKACVDEFGQFHFLGRADKQVKIRGQRLELNEIERILNTLVPSNQWIAFAFDSGFALELGVAFKGNLGAQEKKILQKQMLTSYPSYYMPSKWIQIDEFEMNQNGKINLQPLIDLAQSPGQLAEKPTYSEDKLKNLLVLIEQLFGLQTLASDNFFSIGLSSFDAMYFVREWNNSQTEQIQVFQLFSSNDFQALANAISYSNVEDYIQEKEHPYIPANFAQEAIWFEIQQKDSSIYNLPHFIALPANNAKIKQNIEKTIQSCFALFVRFELTENGELRQYPLDPLSFFLEEIILTKENFARFQRDSYFDSIDLTKGPSFKANIVHCDDQIYLYFNPHHIVYDGGSDAAVATLFEQFSQGLIPKPIQITRPRTSSFVNWDTYFKLADSPSSLKGCASEKLEKNIVSLLSMDEETAFKQIQKKWRVSPSVIHSLLLGEALQQVGITIDWLSMVVDTRDNPTVGMFMRAFPFPVNSNESLNERIGIGNAAMEFIFKNKDAAIRYPRPINPVNYHQVGLVIQHPVPFVEGASLNQVEFSRARLPLTLYVERYGDNLKLIWEFDSGYVTQDLVEKLSSSYGKIIKKWGNTAVNIVPKLLNESSSFNSQSVQREQSVLKDIWEKYLGAEAGNDFFQAGGTSLKVLMMIKEIESKTATKISIVDFFKSSTFEFLEANERKRNDSFYWQMQEGKLGEDWYFPPIFGLGLIFNTYPLTIGHQSTAFNYPFALGLAEEVDDIESLAKFLVDSYKKVRPIPKLINRIVSYSMGAIVAFEVIKLLEKEAIFVDELIVWDKPAQLAPPPKKIKCELNPKLITYAEQLGHDERQKDQIINYLNSHQFMIESYQQRGKIASNITVYSCQDGFKSQSMKDWKSFTKGKFLLISIPKELSHYEIPSYWRSEGIK